MSKFRFVVRPFSSNGLFPRALLGSGGSLQVLGKGCYCGPHGVLHNYTDGVFDKPDRTLGTIEYITDCENLSFCP